jgi:hypothetical protein
MSTIKIPYKKISSGIGGDLQTNMSMGYGRMRCHGDLDLTTTITGDLALTSDSASNTRQRILMWLATPKGERLDPSIGCCLYDFLHSSASPTNVRKMESYIAADINYLFNDLGLKVKSVTCRVADDVNSSVYVDIKMGNEDLGFLFTYNELINLSSQLASVYSITG